MLTTIAAERGNLEHEAMTTHTDDDRSTPASDLVEEVFLRLQRELAMEWRAAAHLLISYGIDALHLNAGPDGTAGELRAVIKEAEEALAELEQGDCERAARERP
jgi:hypothetical protein